MYTIFMIIIIGFGLWLAVSGLRSGRRIRVAAGILIAVGILIFFWFMGFWGEVLWFDSLGFNQRFWEVFRVRIFAGTGCALFSAGFVYLLTLGYSRRKQLLRYAAVMLGALLGLNMGIANWENILRFIHAVPTELRDPIFGQTTSFYFFYLPLLNAAGNLLLFLSFISLAATAADVYLELDDNTLRIELSGRAGRTRPIYYAAGILLAVKAYMMFLKRYYLMYSDVGPITGPGWTDVHIRLPAIVFMIAVYSTAAAIMFFPPLRRTVVALVQPTKGE